MKERVGKRGLHAWVLEIHWGKGGAADFLGLAWVRVEEVLFDGAEKLMLDGDVSVIVVGSCFAAGGLKLVRTETCPYLRSIPYV